MSINQNLQTEIDIVHCDHPYTEYDSGKVEGLEFAMDEIMTLAVECQGEVDALQFRIENLKSKTCCEINVLISTMKVYNKIIQHLVGKTNE